MLKNYNIHAVKGHQFPGEAYIETNIEMNLTKDEIEVLTNHCISQNLSINTYEIDRHQFNNTFDKVPYFIPEDKIFRICHIDGFTPVPCGETHVRNTSKIGNIIIKKVSNKNGGVKDIF